MWRALESELLRRFIHDPKTQAALPALLAAVRSGRRSPARAARDLLG
jgi:hypothetical protein